MEDKIRVSILSSNKTSKEVVAGVATSNISREAIKVVISSRDNNRILQIWDFRDRWDSL